MKHLEQEIEGAKNLTKKIANKLAGLRNHLNELKLKKKQKGANQKGDRKCNADVFK